ncbi:MAG: SIR2 family protein [Methylococcaceae bacterium]
MNNIPSLQEYYEPPEEIIQAGLDGKLVLFVGAGVSMLAPINYPSWATLANKILEDLRKEQFINYSEFEQLKILDSKKQLSIAHFIAENKKFPIDYKKYFEGKSETNSIYEHINAIGCPCITTNYDELLAPRVNKNNDGSTTDLFINRISEPEKFLLSDLDKRNTVIHLHGAISNPRTMIITTKNYLKHYEHDNVKTLLAELFSIKVVLFIGYGLEEMEILEQILRKGSATEIKERKRFALQGFFTNEKYLYENLWQYYKNTFGIHLLGFNRDIKNFDCLKDIIEQWSSIITINKPSLFDDIQFMNEVLGDE